MKKLIIALCLILLPTLAWAGCMILGGGTPAEGGGTTCTLLDSCLGIDDNTQAAATYFIGQGQYYTATNATICRVDLNIHTVPTSGAMSVVIYTMTGSNLTTLIGTSESKAYTTLSTGWNTFLFSPSIAVTGGGSVTYGIAGVSTLAAWNIYDSATLTLDQGNIMRWTNLLANDGTWTDYDAGIKIYTDQ